MVNDVLLIRFLEDSFIYEFGEKCLAVWFHDFIFGLKDLEGNIIIYNMNPFKSHQMKCRYATDTEKEDNASYILDIRNHYLIDKSVDNLLEQP